ncbi:glycosyltransferase family 2 protein [Bacteroides heparinolyticus]
MISVITASLVLYKSNSDTIRDVIRSFFSDRILNKKLLLIDNSPTDELRFLQEERPEDIIYIFNNKNVGFGTAHNIGEREAQRFNPDFHLILNPDVVFGPEVIPSMVKYMEQHRDIGLMVPQVYYPDGKRQHLCKLLPRPWDVFLRRFFPVKPCITRTNERYELRFWSYETIEDIPSLSGCFMLVRTDIYNQVGGFDERFFMYAEDLDLCRRIGQISRTVFFPSASITHAYARASYHDARLLKHHMTSLFLYFTKWGWIFDAERDRINKTCIANLAPSNPKGHQQSSNRTLKNNNYVNKKVS